MISAVIKWSIGNRILVLIATVAIAIAGYLSVITTPVDAIPDLSDVQVIVKTTYAGQSPQVVEDQITYPLTTALMAVPGAKTVRGFSFFGDSYIYIIFDEDTDLYWARSRVLEYLSQSSDQLPEGVRPEIGPDATGVGWVYMYALVDESGALDSGELRALQDWFLSYELRTVPGVSEVASVGGMVKQFLIEVNPQKLRAYNIPLSLIETAVKQGNQEAGASVIEMAEAEYMVTVSGYLSTLSSISHLPLGVAIDGVPLKIDDVAEVYEAPLMRRGVAELNGEGEVVGGIIVMRADENAKAVIDNVKVKIAALQRGLPKGVNIVPVYDRSTLITRATDNLFDKLVEELFVVGAVCLIFLFHVRSSLVAVISLPIGILLSFIAMKVQGINANIMSLGGIAIAIGAMVDGAIVVVENVHKHIEKEQQKGDVITSAHRWSIVTKATLEVGPALFFSLLIITVSFVPVFALEAQEGRLFSPLAFTKTYAMAGAALLAITLVPVLAGYLVKGRIRSEQANPVNRWLESAYTPLLTRALRHPWKVVVITLAIMISTLWPLSKLGSEFMPSLDEGDLMYMPTTYPGIAIGKARELLQQTNKLILTVPEVESVFGKVGRADTATDPAPLTMIETFIQLKPKSQWREGLTLDGLKEELNSRVDFPGVTNAWVMPIKTRIDMLATGIKTPVGIKVAGANLEDIERIGQKIEQLLVNVEGTASVFSERVVSGRYIDIHLDKEKAARYNLNVTDIQQMISSAVGGRVITQTVEGRVRSPVTLRYPQSYRDSPESLAALPIVTQQGAQLSLGDIASIEVNVGPTGIKSENGRLNGWVFIDIDESDIGGYVENAKAYLAENLSLPVGYSLTWAGQFEYLARAKAKLNLVIPFTVAIICLFLFFAFGRVIDVLLIALSLPLAVVGSIWLVYLMSFNLSVAVGVGLIALAGVAVEVGVIMLVYLHQSVNEVKNLRVGESTLTRDELDRAIVEGAKHRLRPIMMTSLSIILGLMPVLFSTGTGAEIMRRIAAPMVGGMASALLLTLFVLPVLYSLVVRHPVTSNN
ncbi:efflux RND transporter permease subunit [Alteromonas sp. A079]|uniref:efflux RND transporter permease subunit n=1 Tax=Alteromonas sp. A079 TaxID=3410268 RepID=UPI003B9DD928